jgi:hypothetical protein
MVVADLPDDGWRDFTLEVLDRWRDEPDVDKAWEEIQKTASSSGCEPPPPFPFIEWVIGEAKIYKRVTCEIIPKSENLENRAIAAAERDWRSRRQPGNADLALTAAAKDKMARDYREKRIRLLGRQPKGVPQKRFIKLCREMFVNNCGQPLEKVIELLTTVVVGHELKPNAVRDALKPTTREGRDTKKQK